jgi:hypothetical protein
MENPRAVECRRKASECLALAKKASNPNIKAEFLAMAEQWLALEKEILSERKL